MHREQIGNADRKNMAGGMRKRQGIHGKQIGKTDRKNMTNKYETKTWIAWKTNRKHRQEKYGKNMKKTGKTWLTNMKKGQGMY